MKVGFLTVAVVCASFAPAGAKARTVSPRILLDAERLDYVPNLVQYAGNLNSGWEMDGTAFVRPFNRPAAGLVRYGGVFALPTNVTARLKFVDAHGRVLAAASVTDGAKVFGSFIQKGDLAALRLEPSRVMPPAGVFVKPLRVTLDWALDEAFSGQETGAAPTGWTCEGATVVDLPYLRALKKEKKAGFDLPCTDAVLALAPGGRAEPSPDSARLTDDYVFEFDAFAEKAPRVKAAGVELNALAPLAPRVWHHFRFEVAKGVSRVRVNGRVVAEGVRVSGFALENRSDERLLVDDVKAFAHESPADYPPPPVRPKGGEKWDVMLNVCPLWYNGHHFGWCCIERGGGPKPVLGYYDEGLPETADWEIKYLVEHGVDVQAFCWYPESHDGPIRHLRNHFHLRDGFKNARYSDRMKYCLIWEAENSGRPHSLAAWKANYVPYLIEHHFKDPRYYAVEGRPVLMVFGGWNLPGKTSFGSAEAVHAAFDYLAAELRKIGFKGLLPIFSGGDARSKTVAACGFEAAAPYGYGEAGWKLQTQIDRNLARAKNPHVFEIPAVSVGFDSKPWHGKRFPMLSPADFKSALAWVRDTFIPGRTYADDWQSRVVLLSNWNEYGEGTYLMPTEDARGFGYLDAVRSVFTDEGPDPALNLKPTPAQRARICNLYPQPR